ncbi:hypothetical protein Moror_11254 [Moniliophthora roreri MCA 2997]|uniref:Uncharacterized protein n=1 Tax=Moniliophthora roreri (strain MCA 2997) TaxID=1381753 RepID=V2WLG6_MONRO|nr:hypothetical protein Moror_11254 [Moniliophthora roreri MCA 2997]
MMMFSPSTKTFLYILLIHLQDPTFHVLATCILGGNQKMSLQSIKYLTANFYLTIRSTTPPPDTFNDFENVFDKVQPLNPKMDNVNSEDAKSYTPNASDHLTLHQKLQVNAASHFNNKNEEDKVISRVSWRSSGRKNHQAPWS